MCCYHYVQYRARQLRKEKYPDEASTFKLSHKWFKGICRRHEISLRRKTHAVQKIQAALHNTIENVQSLYVSKKEELTLSKSQRFDKYGRNTNAFCHG